MISKNIFYDMAVIGSFAILGILIKLFFPDSYTSDGNNGPALTAIWGYGFTIISILALIFVSVAFTSKMTKLEKNSFSFIYEVFTNSLIPTLILGLVVWILTLNILYFKRINQNHVAPEYHTYSNISSILIVIQLGILFKYLFDGFKMLNGTNIDEHKISKERMGLISYLITTINIIIIGILTIILEFYSTDG